MRPSSLVRTTCPYCGCGCNFYLKVKGNNIVGIIPDARHPVSRGGRLCCKGWSGYHFINHPDRLTTPLIKKRGKFHPASWKEALDYTARRLAEIKDKYGPDSLAVLSSAKCTNEENYLLMKFTRLVLGTNNIDHCARLCHASTVAGLAQAFGSGAMTNSINELLKTDLILIIGSNTSENHPLIASRVIQAVGRGAKLIICDPRKLELTPFAHMHLQQKPGTDVALINGFMNVILRNKLEDKGFIKRRTEGFLDLIRVSAKYTPNYVSRITGVAKGDIIRAGRLYGSAKKATILYAMGITQHTSGTDNVLSLANLALFTGNVGREGTGVDPLRGQNNVQGACDLGALPGDYSGYQKVGDPEIRAKFSRAWKRELPEGAGLTVVEMMQSAARGKIRGMYIMGENPMMSDPDISHVREALSRLDFLVHQDIFLNETGMLADVVLPAASFAEKDGTITSTERRIQRYRRAIRPPGEARPDWEIICELSRRMGYPMRYSSAAEIMDEIASLTPIYAGIDYRRLEENGLQWPCPNKSHPGTKFLHQGKFSRGKGKFTPVEYRPPRERPDKKYPLTLTTGRVLFQFHTRTMSGRSSLLDREEPEGFVEINPKTAKRLGVARNEMVRVETRRGEICLKARITSKITEDTLFIPFHFASSPANRLTNAALDPTAKIPELKVCAARLEKQEEK